MIGEEVDLNGPMKFSRWWENINWRKDIVWTFLKTVTISQTFIAGLTTKIKYEKLNTTAIRPDILSMQPNQKFSGAICMGDSFGYFNFGKMKLFVEKVSSVPETDAMLTTVIW